MDDEISSTNEALALEHKHISHFFKTGNQFWRKRKKHGKDPKFLTPEHMWEACCEYFIWVDENPMQECKVFSHQGEIIYAPLFKPRPMTISGMCVFLGIAHRTWSDYRHREEFAEMVSEVEAVIFDQKFAAAAADLMNPTIIARDLGLKEYHSQTVDVNVTKIERTVVKPTPTDG